MAVLGLCCCAQAFLVVASRGYSLLRCVGFSLRWLLLLRSIGSRHTGSVVVARGLQSTSSVVVAHGLSCSAACGIFLDQGLNLCALPWQVDSFFFLIYLFIYFGCVESWLLHVGSCGEWGLLFVAVRGLLIGVASLVAEHGSRHMGFSSCMRVQQLWLTGLVAPRHVGSSRTRARTHVPCIGRWILNHCATREAPAG